MTKPEDLAPAPSQRALERAGARDFLRRESRKQRARAVPVNTERAYKSDWAQFERWCERLGYEPEPAGEEALCAFLTHLSLDRKTRTRKKGPEAGKKIEGFAYQATSIERKLTAIVKHHKQNGHPSPRTAAVTEQMRAVWKDRESKPKAAAPLLGSHLKAIVGDMRSVISRGGPRAEVALRDRAALLVGWHCAMRRSEVAALKVGSIEFFPEGMTVHIGRSKTDQQGKGRTLWIKPMKNYPEACPLAAVREWLELRGEDPGALFWASDRITLRRGEQMPAWQMVTIIDRWTAKIAPESKGSMFTPHSLRAGFITQASRMKRPTKETMDHSGHRSFEVFMGYVRVATGFETTVQDNILGE